MLPYQREFIDLALARQALRFGSFTPQIRPRSAPTSSTPDYLMTVRPSRAWAAATPTALAQAGLTYDMLFGPAYKGIPLVAATAVALAEHHDRNVPWAFNRKEAKDHGEAGVMVGTPLKAAW